MLRLLLQYNVKKMDETLLLRFLTRQCTPAEIRQIEQWISADQANADWLFEMERIWGLKDEQRFSDRQEVENAFRRFQSGIRRQRTATCRVLKYAAAVIVPVLLLASLYMSVRNRTEDALNTVEVPAGQQITLTLSDGTKVWLNSQTTFSYPSSFTDGNREVTLRGEGFFEVVASREKPFTVHSSLLHVTVSGTKFNIKAYAGEPSYVTLAEGEVEVSVNDETGRRLTLRPNQQVSCSEEKQMTLIKNIDTERVKSWTDGELCFVDQPLSVIAAELERRFNVDIRIQNDTLAADIFTCRFKKNVTVEQILTFLKKTRRINYKTEDQKVEITNY